MFDRCDFLLGEGKSIVMVVPAQLPRAETFTVSISPEDIRFRADYDEIARIIPYQNREVYARLSQFPQVGVVEYPKGAEFPDRITAVAYVELRKPVQ